VYGIYACTFYSVFKGNTAIMMPGFDPTTYLKLVQEYKVTLEAKISEVSRIPC
jgi:ribosomal protein L10